MGCFSTRATALRIAQLCRIYRCLLSAPSPWTARSRKNSLLENKGIAVGLSFPPHKDVEAVGGAELSEVWCVFLGFLVFLFFYRAATCGVVGVNICASQAGPGAFICSPASSAPPSRRLSSRARLVTSETQPCLGGSGASSSTADACGIALARALLGTPTPRAVNLQPRSCGAVLSRGPRSNGISVAELTFHPPPFFPMGNTTFELGWVTLFDVLAV